MNTNFKDAANSFLDELAGIIETSVQSGKYELHSKLFEHVRWTPSGWHLDPCRPYPFGMRTKSFNMELCPPQSQEKFARWLIVKESNMGKNSGYGLFADRVFRKDDNITVYFGKKADTRSKDETRMLEIKGHLIDVKPTCFGARPLYFGVHFANSPYYQIPDEKHDDYDRSAHAGRNPNAEIVGVMIKCTQDIQRGEEIRLDYGHRKRPATVTTKINKSAKKKRYSA